MESRRKKFRELYDLASDPSETTNVIDQYSEVEFALANQISDIVSRGRTTAGNPQSNDTAWWEDLVWMKP
jgi:arylsulfatase A